jgi:hypothetical protein
MVPYINTAIATAKSNMIIGSTITTKILFINVFADSPSAALAMVVKYITCGTF